MEVIILAGGLGTRLRDTIGSEVPKCMAEVAGKPFLWILLKYLEERVPYLNDIGHPTRVILSVGHLRDKIFRWIDEVKSQFPFQFDFAVEETPLGTGGGIKLALSKCTEPIVFVLNGDTYFDVDIKSLGEKLYKDNQKHGAIVEIALAPMENFSRYGSVTTKADGEIVRFNEKRFCESGDINGGIYAIAREAFSELDLPEKFSFEKEVLEKQCTEGKLYGMVSDGYFIDIGVPEDYAKANEYFKDKV